MVYARTVDDAPLTLIVSGRLWRNSLVMQDEETGTFWSHVTGEALAGPLAGRELEPLPSVQTTWSRWRDAHPETLLLRKSRAIRSSRYEDYFADPDRTGLFRGQWLVDRLPGKSLVHGVTEGPHALAVTDAELDEQGVVTGDLAGVPVAFHRGPDGGVRAWRARVTGRDLRLRPTGEQHLARGRATGSTWDLARGVATAGPLAGERLRELPVTAAFWFAWSSFYPNTEIIGEATSD